MTARSGPKVTPEHVTVTVPAAISAPAPRVMVYKGSATTKPDPLRAGEDTSHNGATKLAPTKFVGNSRVILPVV